MIVLLDFCSLHWLLPWLLPFLLGLLLGWLLWGRYKQMVAELNEEVSKLKARIADLEADLANCRAGRSDLESEIALLKGRIRELESAGSSDSRASMKINVGGGEADVVKTTTAVATGIAGAGKGKYVIAANKFGALPKDNLQIIEGIGPKMESLLKDNSIGSWNSLGAKSAVDLNNMLAKYGDKYRIIDPANWPKQAQLADDGKWDDLIALQKNLGVGGRKRSSGDTDSKVEKMLVKLGILKQWKLDDLKAVEGVGPKIEKLLQNGGIKTWRGLSNTTVSKIQEILDAAGDRYRLADPESWPEQAGLAADGNWDALEDLQKRLTGGRK